MKKILTVLMCAVMLAGVCFGFSGCKNDENKLKIGFTYYAPMNYLDENNNFVGFDTEFAELVCEELGYTPEFIEINWNNKVISLNAKEIDCIWNGMTITDELKSAIAITDSYMENQQVVVCKQSDAASYADIASLAGKSIAVESGSAGEKVVNEAEELKNASVTLNGFEAQKDTLIEVKTGASNIAIIDITMAKAMTGEGTEYNDLTYVDVGFAKEEYGIGVRKEDTELLNKLNEIIAKFKTDGTLDTLYNKYMG